MAIDTAQKRMSAVHHAAPWRGPLVAAAEVGFTQGNRQAAAFMYSGILATESAEEVIGVGIRLVYVGWGVTT